MNQNLVGAQLILLESEVRKLDGHAVFGMDGQRCEIIVPKGQELDVHRKLAAVESPVMHPSGFLVVDVQIEVLHHLKHQIRRLEVHYLVVDINPGLSETQIGKCRGYVCRNRAAFIVLLDEDGSAAVVDRRGLKNIECRNEEADSNRDRKPVPSGDAHVPDVLDAEGLFPVGGVLGNIVPCFHIQAVIYNFSLYLDMRASSEAASDAMEIQVELDLRVLPLTVDSLIRLSLGVT